MRRRRLALCAPIVLALACNSYQFSPAGHCVIRPGSVHVTLDDTSTVDLLFVVDDSPSMDPKQLGLASSFRDFVQRMVETNTARAAKGVLPIDFHIAVTTSSVFSASPASTSCVTASGAPQCCQTSACQNVTSCGRGGTAGCGGGQVCVVRPTFDANGTVTGEQRQCCTAGACAPSAGCAAGDACPTMTTTYPNPFPSSSFCTPGLATAGAPYLAGDLVSAGGNPKVLDFPKALGWASWGTAGQDPALTALVAQFTQNVRVGSCGSGEEQHLEGARLALEKAALAGTGFPHAGAKLIVVWVGDEDDCSSPASAPLVMSSFTPGADSCVLDKHRPAADQRETPVAAYADFFAGLVHPGGAASLGAAFIVASARCADGTYAPADACTGGAACPVSPPAACAPAASVSAGAYAAGERFFALADALRARGAQVVEGTVCDAYPPSTFGPVLSAIADLARPPSSLELPSQPAARAVTTVTIQDTSGQTRRVCSQGTDWCFVDCADRSAAPACLPAGTSRCIAIDHANGRCEASPGETYAAEFLGVVPPEGCATAADCDRTLGAQAGGWTCSIEAGASRGTCTCAGS